MPPVTAKPRSYVYCLSTERQLEAAKLLANNEKLSDIIGGVPTGEVKIF
jgi:hypothetical protein